MGLTFYAVLFGVDVAILALLFGAGTGITIVLTNILGFLVAIGAVEAAKTDLQEAQDNAESEID